MDAFEVFCVLFLDHVSSIANFLPILDLTDAIGHSVDYLRFFCVFQKSKVSACAIIAYWNSLHTKHKSLMRFDARMDTARNTMIIIELFRHNVTQNVYKRKGVCLIYIEIVCPYLPSPSEKSSENIYRL